MITIMGSLRILVPGTKFYSKQECLENSDYLEYNRLYLKYMVYDKRTHKKFEKSEVKSFTTTKVKPIVRVLPITDIAYDYFISDSCPDGVSISAWKHFNKDQKLNWHFERIAHDLGGTVEGWEILED